MILGGFFLIAYWKLHSEPSDGSSLDEGEGHNICFNADLTLLHSELPKLHRVLAILSAMG